jgi:hypothetical protein
MSIEIDEKINLLSDASVGSVAFDRCPKCKANLCGPPIAKPLKDKGYYGDQTHFSYRIGIVNHDRVTHWRCPDCDHVWKR